MEERATRPFQTRFAAVALRAISMRIPLFIYLTGAGTTPPGPASSPRKRHEGRGSRDEARKKRPHPSTSIHDPIHIVSGFFTHNDPMVRINIFQEG